MASTAKSTFIGRGITIFYQTVLKSQPEDVSGVPYLALAFVQTFNRERLVQTLREFVLTFVNCSPTILKEYIEDQELLASGLDPDEVDLGRDVICRRICGLVRSYGGVEGMERLQVDVVFETNWDPGFLAFERWLIDSRSGEVMHPPANEEEHIRRINTSLRRMDDLLMMRGLVHPSDVEEEYSGTMRFVHKFVYGGATGRSPAAVMGGGEEVCGICMEAMKLGEMLIRTPCVHHFHASCIRPWFKRSCFCPLCRFKIDHR